MCRIRKWGQAIIGCLLIGLMLVTACQSVAYAANTTATTKPATTTPATTPASTAQFQWPMQIVGQFSISPGHAAIGDTVTATGSGLTPGYKYTILWEDVIGSWDVDVVKGTYSGRNFADNWLTLATVTTDAQGNFKASFLVPEGFGFAHDVLVMDNGTIRNKCSFSVDMQASLATTQGPLGSPITIVVKGMGWKDYQNGWHVLYDNQNVGILTSVTTHGQATAVIPATGGVGKHIIRVIEGAWTVSYLNHEECPFPDTPTFTLVYEITSGAPVLPLPPAQQTLPIQKGTAPAPSQQPQIWTDPYLAPVGTPMTVRGAQMLAGVTVDLYWDGKSGNRVTSGGYQDTQTLLGSVKTSGNGTFEFTSVFPDTHGGLHLLEAQVDGKKIAETYFNITPSAIGIEPASGPVGTVIHIHLKAVSWTVTANNYYLVYDNVFNGYSCGFNSYGDVNIYLPATGQPGWHFIDLYPGIYKGTEKGSIDEFRTPQLTFTDHPGETLPAFHFAFYVTG